MTPPATAKNGFLPPLLVGLLCCLLGLVAAAPASAAPAWLAPFGLSAPGRDASNAAVASDDAGNTLAIWERQHPSGPSHYVQVATRSPGGAFSPPVDVSLSSTDPELSVSPGGQAVVAWRHFVNPPGNYAIQVAARPPGGSLSAPVDVAEVPTTAAPNGVRVAVNDAGDTVVAWTQLNPSSGLLPNPFFVMASVRPAGGSFSVPVRVSPPRLLPPEGSSPTEEEEWEEEQALMTASSPSVAIDPAGNAIVVWQYNDATNFRVQAAVRPPGGSFSAPVSISAAGENAGGPDVATDAAGNEVAVWGRDQGSDRIVQASTRPPGGSFAPAVDLTAPGTVSGGTSVALTPGGLAAVIWTRVGEGENFVETANRPPGGAFSSPQPLSQEGEHPLFPEFAINAGGTIAVTWSGQSGAGLAAKASIGAPGGGFSIPVAISPTSADFFHPTVGIDAGGNATGVWTRSDGKNEIAEAAGYDGAAPALRDLAIPSTGTVGVPVSFSATPFDAWPIGPAGFSFGDGAEAGGNVVSHAYSAPGTYQVTVSAVDAAGTRTAETRPIAISPRRDFTLGKLKLNKKKGTATLAVNIPGPGKVALTGRGIEKATKRAARAATVTLAIKAQGKGLKGLRKRGRWKSKLKVAFTPDGGTTNVVDRKVTLIKKPS